MKMIKGEVVLNIPAEKAWEMYRNNEIISKINPKMLFELNTHKEMVALEAWGFSRLVLVLLYLHTYMHACLYPPLFG